MAIIAEQRVEHKLFAQLWRKLIVLGVVFLICYTLFKIIADFTSFSSDGTLSDFLIPAALSFLFLPMLYLLSIKVTHDDVFIGIERSIKNPGLRRYARWKALIHFHVNKTDLNHWRRLLFLLPIKSKGDVNNSIERIKEMKLKKKLSAPVEFEKGWSPYRAMKFLQEKGITSGDYQPTIDENEWIACSNHVKVDENLPASNISYYVEGDANVVTKLLLTLTVFNGRQDGFAIAQFLDSAGILYKSALNQTMPQQIEDKVITGHNSEMKVGNRKIVIEKKQWGNKNGGYHVNFKIDVHH